MSKRNRSHVSKSPGVSPQIAGTIIKSTNIAMQDVERKIEVAHVQILNQAHHVASLIDLLEDIRDALHRLYEVSDAKSLIQDRIAHRSQAPSPGAMRPIEPALTR